MEDITHHVKCDSCSTEIVMPCDRRSALHDAVCNKCGARVVVLCGEGILRGYEGRQLNSDVALPGKELTDILERVQDVPKADPVYTAVPNLPAGLVARYKTSYQTNDGVYTHYIRCSCGLDNIVPCQQPFTHPGHSVTCTCGVRTTFVCDFHKSPSDLPVETPLNRQVGGDHYKKLAIQPVEYAMKNNLNFCQASAIKYVTRYKDKGGVEDLKKAKHFIDLLIEFEEKQ